MSSCSSVETSYACASRNMAANLSCTCVRFVTVRQALEAPSPCYSVQALPRPCCSCHSHCRAPLWPQIPSRMQVIQRCQLMLANATGSCVRLECRLCVLSPPTQMTPLCSFSWRQEVSIAVQQAGRPSPCPATIIDEVNFTFNFTKGDHDTGLNMRCRGVRLLLSALHPALVRLCFSLLCPSSLLMSLYSPHFFYSRPYFFLFQHCCNLLADCCSCMTGMQLACFLMPIHEPCRVACCFVLYG